MEVYISTNSERSIGGGGLWVDALQGLLEEHLAPYSGSLRELGITAWFLTDRQQRTQGIDPTDWFQRAVASLPKSRVMRKFSKVTIEFVAEFATLGTAFGTEYGNNPRKPIGIAMFRRELLPDLARAILNELKLIERRLRSIEGLDAQAMLSAAESVLRLLPSSPVEAEAIREIADARRKQLDAADPWRALGIEWESFHRQSKALLNDPWYWDCGDDSAPNGNDTGADILEDMRRSRLAPEVFLNRTLQEWGMGLIDWEMQNHKDVLAATETDETAYVVCEEAVLAAAFAEIKLRGKSTPPIRKLALAAIERRLNPAVLAWWVPDEQGVAAREELVAALEKMRAALKAFEG